MTCRPIKHCGGDFSTESRCLKLTVNELVFNMENDETSVIRSANAKTMAIVLIFLASADDQL